MSPIPRLLRVAAAALLACSAACASDKLVAHIIPHSHCDPGWLDSFESYYTTQVGNILSSVLKEVRAAPHRRFVWAESSFFMRYYESQPRETQAAWRDLVASGQVEFVGGGWVQNDEANPSYDAVLSQLAEGHEYLLTLFGVKPRIAWSIDPFGSSSATAAISALAGYDALVINRIEHGVKDALKSRAAMEFVWKPYATSPAVSPLQEDDLEAHVPSVTNVSIFTHVLHTHYSAPRGFDFENPEGQAIHAGNVAGRAAELAGELRRRANAYRSSHLLVPFGDDFKFQDAGVQFRNMDQLVEYVAAHNAEPTAGAVFNLELRYSTLSEYFEAVWAEAYTGEVHPSAASPSPAPAADADGDGAIAGKIVFPLVAPSQADGGVDWFPYADNDQSWWVGYYDSRPLLKQMIRRAFYSVRAADALLALVRPWAGEWQTMAKGIVAAATAGIRGALNATQDDAALAGQVGAWEPFFSASPYASFSWLNTFQRIESARLDAALCLHHDAITGTSRSHVVDDYLQRMATAVRDAHAAIADMASLALGGLSKHMTTSTAAGAGITSLAPAPLTHVPHILPIAATMDLAHLHVDSGSGHVKGATPALPAHPVIVYNPTGWRRTMLVSVVIDVASHAATATGNDDACPRSAWPVGIVVNDHRRAVRSQWRAVVEARETGKASLTAYSTSKMAGIVLQGGAGDAVPLEPQRGDAPVAGRVRSTPRVDQVTTGVRYELTFEATVPAYGLSTYFVSAAWRLIDSAADVMHPPCELPSEAGASDAFTAPVPTWVHLPGLAASLDSSTGASPLPPQRLLAVEAPAAAPNAASSDPPPLILENLCLRVEVDSRTGMIAALTHKNSQPAASGTAAVDDVAVPVRVRVTQSLAAYNTQRSGAYMFIPVGAPVPMTAAVDDPDGVTVSISAPSAFSTDASSPSLVQEVRVVGGRFSQTIRLVDSLSRAKALDVRQLREACADPLLPDGALDIRPTVSARGNEEVVMLLDTSLDISAGATSDNFASPNVRDQTSTKPGTASYPNIVVADGAAGGAAATAMAQGGYRQLIDAVDGSCVSHSAPHGWWTSDGLALLRRRPAHVAVGDGDIQRYYYPLNTLTRLSGAASPDATAWMTLFAAQPFGTATRIKGATGSVGSRLEVMLHRHLVQDDGRGLATGVDDNTVLTAQLSLQLGSERHSPCGGHSAGQAASGSSGDRIVDGAGAAHEDWLWTWATRAAIHHATGMTLHADLVAIGGPVAAAAAAAALKHVAPPGDGSTLVGSPGVAKAEAAVPIAHWTSRFATRFVPIQSDGWYLSTHTPREDAYAADLPGLCAHAAAVSPQVCHHLTPDTTASHGASHAGLPPWLHVLTLQVRDAVTDDVVLRVQNFGGPASVVDVEALLSGSHKPHTRGSAYYAAAVSHPQGDAAAAGSSKGDVSAVYAHTPLRVRAVRRRSLTLNRHEGYAAAVDGGARVAGHRHRLSFPSMLLDEMAATKASSASTRFPLALAGVFESLHAAPEAVRKDITSFLGRMGAVNVATRFAAAEGVSISDMLGTGEKQNTEEEGVFLSDAALKKLAEDKKRAAARIGGLRLLALPAAAPAAADLDITIAPASVRSFIAVVDADSPDPDDLLRALLPSIALPAPAAAGAAAKRATAAQPVIDTHPSNEALAAVVDRINALVRNATLRDAMVAQVTAGRALTAVQDALLHKLGGKTQRKHDIAAPSNLAAIVAAKTRERDAGADKCLPGSPCDPTDGAGIASGRDMTPARIPFEGVPAEDPWPREGESEQSLRRLLRTLQSEMHGISTGWVSRTKHMLAAATSDSSKGAERPSPVAAPGAGIIDAGDVFMAPAAAKDAAAVVAVDDNGDDFIVSVALVVIIVAGCVLYCCRARAGKGSGGPLLPTTAVTSAGEADATPAWMTFLTGTGARTALKRVVNSSKVQ